MIETLVFLVIYLSGVFVSMIMVAYINRDGEELIPEIISVLSWAIVIGMILLPVAFIVSWPFEKLQEYLNNKFKKS